MATPSNGRDLFPYSRFYARLVARKRTFTTERDRAIKEIVKIDKDCQKIQIEGVRCDNFVDLCQSLLILAISLSSDDPIFLRVSLKRVKKPNVERTALSQANWNVVVA